MNITEFTPFFTKGVAMGYSVKILADSLSLVGARLTTMEISFPRYLLAEFNTHRAFSRNSASSRAIPILKMIERVEKEPFVPIYWGSNQPGMQAGPEIDKENQKLAKQAWLYGVKSAIKTSRRLHELGVHKEIANRPLEPYMWHTVVVTATEWSNFFALRNHDDSDKHICIIASMMEDAYNTNNPMIMRKDEWHLPLIQDHERDGRFEYTKEARMVSAARCARTSYLTHDGKRDIEKDIALYRRLVSNGHLSPLEHVAKQVVDRGHATTANFDGWLQLRKTIPNEHDYSLVIRKG